MTKLVAKVGGRAGRASAPCPSADLVVSGCRVFDCSHRAPQTNFIYACVSDSIYFYCSVQKGFDDHPGWISLPRISLFLPYGNAEVQINVRAVFRS